MSIESIQALRRLLLSLAIAGDRHLTKIEADLIQTDVLLDEAVAKLTGSFMELHKAVVAQQEAFGNILNGRTNVTEELVKLQELYEEVNKQVNSAVTGLQFQDMTSQLLERVVRRVIGLREVLDILNTSGNQMPPDASNIDDMKDLFQNTANSMDARMSELEAALWRAVRQTRMESGDVDLF